MVSQLGGGIEDKINSRRKLYKSMLDGNAGAQEDYCKEVKDWLGRRKLICGMMFRRRLIQIMREEGKILGLLLVEGQKVRRQQVLLEVVMEYR